MESEKKYNDTLVTMFNDDRWGEGNYLSAEIDAKAFDVLQTIGLGDKLLFKTTMRSSKNGNAIAFIEIVKPRGDIDAKYRNTKGGVKAARTATQTKPKF